MNTDTGLWLTLFWIGSTTILTRGSFIIPGERLRLPGTLQRLLRYSPAAALAALIAPEVFIAQGQIQGLNPKLAAALVVMIVTLKFRNPWLPFVLGMGVLWAVETLVPL